jgi:hypothetical protein
VTVARPQPVRRRTRLARGPLTIGEPAAAVDARLAATEPYRPDTVADGGDAFGLTVRAASVRGLYKRHLGGPRQDDLCLRLHPPTSSLILAVADGVSAAARSDLAAALAVRHATVSVDRQLERGAAEVDWAPGSGALDPDRRARRPRRPPRATHSSRPNRCRPPRRSS